MKRALILMATCSVLALTGQAQTAIENSKTTDNWYVGVGGGVSSKTTHHAVLHHLNPHASLRVGRAFTPVFGFLAEGTAFADDRLFGCSKTAVTAVNAHLMGTVNLSNWLGGYYGQPRRVELVGLVGWGWNHIFGYKSQYENDLTSKLGLDLVFNMGQARAWQFFIEPAICYDLDRYHRPHYNINHSALQLSVGFQYKFGNSNGTHYFRLAQVRDQHEIDVLNARVNELRSSVETKDKQLKADERTIAELRASLEEARQQPAPQPQQVTEVRQVIQRSVLQPTVIFGQGMTTVDAAQYASIAMIARYMRNHAEARILIRGYASPEGDPAINQRLSEARANAVKQALVARYGVAESRLTTQGMGATDELFDEVDFNRVVTFTDLTK